MFAELTGSFSLKSNWRGKNTRSVGTYQLTKLTLRMFRRKENSTQPERFEMTTHFTSHDWGKFGVRPCVVVADRGRNLTVRIGAALVTIPRTSVYATAAMALDEAARQNRAECARALRYWRARAQAQIAVHAAEVTA